MYQSSFKLQASSFTFRSPEAEDYEKFAKDEKKWNEDYNKEKYQVPLSSLNNLLPHRFLPPEEVPV